MKKNKKTGFTLIELLVTIVVIGILATISVATYFDYIERAKMAELRAEMQDIKTAIILARINADKTFKGITGDGCSECACRTGENLHEMSLDHECVTIWKDNIAKISEVAGVDELPFYIDPWGAPYVFDENEEEWDDCREDSLISVGPDGVYGIYVDDEWVDGGVGHADNIFIKIPHYLRKDGCN